MRSHFAESLIYSSLWEVPEADHMGAIESRPEEYERRVVGFFNAALR